MKKEKLEQEHKQMLASLHEKNEFVYSREFYDLDEEKRRQHIKAKIASENLVNSLTSLLYDEHTVSTNGIGDMFMLYIMTSMLGASNGFATQSPSLDYLKETLKKDEESAASEGNPA